MKRSKKLSVIIPVFNEEKTILQVIKDVKKKSIRSLELIVIDDGSTDSTKKILKRHKKKIDHLIFHKNNLGKGAAIMSGLKKASGKVVIIQDADLEYDPAEHKQLITPILDGKADAVYGSRFVGSKPHRVIYFWHYLANNILTIISNLITNLNLTDMETGFKAFDTQFIKQIELQETGFNFEPEVTLKLAKRKARFYEMGISYHGRTYQEGKKIQLIDAFKAIWALIKYL